MTKEELEQYSKLKKEITYLEDKIKKLEQKNPITSDSVQIGFMGKRKKIGSITGIDVKQQKKISEYRTKLYLFKAQLVVKQAEIEDFIESIEDTDLRLIIRYRYEDGCSWIKIMHMMEYKSESAARMKHDRFFEKIL